MIKEVEKTSIIEAIILAVMKYDSQGIQSTEERENVSIYIPRYIKRLVVDELKGNEHMMFDTKPIAGILRMRGYKVVDGYEDAIVVAHAEDIFYNPSRIIKIDLKQPKEQKRFF